VKSVTGCCNTILENAMFTCNVGALFPYNIHEGRNNPEYENKFDRDSLT
jgi:hypothetical protein